MATSPNLLTALAPMTLAVGLSVFALVCTAPPAEAEPPAEAVSVEVQLGDLDVTNAAGAEAALARIERAAREVCREAAPRSLLDPRAVHECRRETVARTLSQQDGDERMLAGLSDADGSAR